MGRDNTIVFGSQLGTPPTSAQPPSPRGTRVQERSVSNRSPTDGPAFPRGAAPARVQRPVSPPAPVSSTASASDHVESQWFASTNPRLAPIGHEIFEERRGWQPPPPSRGLAFTAVSVLLVAVAGAGTLFLFGPDNRPSSATPVSTTTITNAEVPAASAPGEPATLDTANDPTKTGTVTPHDLPSAPPVVDAVKEPGRAGKAADVPKATPAPAARSQKAAVPGKRATPPAATKKSEGSLPDLERAASAAGMTTQQDDPFATPGTDTPPASTASTPVGTTDVGGASTRETPSPEPSAPVTATPAPSEVMPDLEIKR